ncbi:response regulator [bacterium]|nr:response regulator [bacterium]
MSENKRINVLVADDEERFRRPLRRALETIGVQVELAANGEEAFQKTRDIEYDIIITDFNMPILNGIELLAQLNEVGSKSRTILMSSYLSEDIIAEAMKYGAITCLDKSFEIDDFLAAVIEVSKT